MARRLFTVASALSLLLCAGASYFWWRSARDGMGSVEVSAAGVRAEFFCSPNGFDATLIRRWPGPAASRAFWGEEEVNFSPHAVTTTRDVGPRTWRWLGLEGERGECAVLLAEDGSVREGDIGEILLASGPIPWSAPVSYWQVADAPPWVPVAATAALPAAWAATRGRAALHRRGDRRRGRCPTCRYDLTGNVSGVCPECGSPAKGAA